METRWSWSKCDEEDLELWAHIDAVQSTHIERGLFCTWLSTVSEYEKEIKAGRQWMLGVQEALEPGGDEWIPGPEFEQKWENDEVCFNHYNDLCDEMEMADNMDTFREEMEQLHNGSIVQGSEERS